MEFIDLKSQRELIREDLDRRMNAVMNHGKFIMGPEVGELETKLAKFVGVKHGIAVANGTDALQIAMMALGIRAGDEVITTAFSFFATVETILVLGAKPIFVDIDPETYNLNPKLLKRVLSSKTKAIIPVSLYGQCADMDEINAVASDAKIPVIEDAAQSFGALYKGKRSCSLSTIASTSFFPSKPLGCYGDGGALFTDNDELADSLRSIRIHGQSKRYHHPLVGVNSRLDTLQAAVLLAKLEVFERELELRDKIGTRYSKLLSGIVKTPKIQPGNKSVYAQYTVEFENRDQVQKKIEAEKIPTAIHYPKGLHQQPALTALFESPSMPRTERAAERVLSLPMHPYLSEQDQDRVVQVVKSSLS